MRYIWWICLLLMGCRDPANAPFSKANRGSQTLFAAFSQSPKTLDPAQANTVEAQVFISQVYETPLEYHWQARPFRLIPSALSKAPKVEYLNDQLHVKKKGEEIAYTRYTLTLRPDLGMPNHPCFKVEGARKKPYLHADDFVYEIKRLASPKVHSPIYGIMKAHIVGFSKLNHALSHAIEQDPSLGHSDHFLDLRRFDLKGVKAIDATHYQILIQGVYPQFEYWLAMPYFSAVPWEMDRWSSDASRPKKSQGLSWQMLGSGPFQLSINQPNRQMVLERNPHFHLSYQLGRPLVFKPQRLPYVDRIIFTMEKESIPTWYKFLQGYYDRSGIGADHFNQVIQFDRKGQPQLRSAYRKKGMHLETSVDPSIFYVGFNFKDPVVGGKSERARLLRRALAIAVDYKEYIRIFLNGRGLRALGPIPPGVLGHEQQNPNPYLYHQVKGQWNRHTLEDAKGWLVKAGYPRGLHPQTHRPLILYLDVPFMSGPDTQAQLIWMQKQVAKLGITLAIRTSQYSRFQDKLRTGQFQMYMLGWVADYPDPENFMFLFYGPNGQLLHQGENTINYQNEDFDRWFRAMQRMKNGPKRLAIIEKMIHQLQKDGPWLWGYYPKRYILTHGWVSPLKPNPMVNNGAKYIALDPTLRLQKQQAWNQGHPAVLLVVGGGLVLVLMGCILHQLKAQSHRATPRYPKKDSADQA